MSTPPVFERDAKNDAEAADQAVRANPVVIVITASAQTDAVFDATIAALLGSSETGSRLKCVRRPFETVILL